MSKIKPVLLLVLAALFVFTSCRKEQSAASVNDEMVSKINSWIDSQKNNKNPIQVQNIELLKSALNYSSLRIENDNLGEKILIVSIRDDLKTKKNLSSEVIPSLVLLMDKSATIYKGNIVLFTPEDHQSTKEVPQNTFSNILNTVTAGVNGKFRFLAITGKYLFELTYKNEKLYSSGIIKPKPKAASVATTTTSGSCVDWYLVTTIYADNVAVDQEWSYIGTTCQSEDCQDPYLAMVCPMDNSSGGGGGSQGILETDEAVWTYADESWSFDVPSGWGGGYIVSYERFYGRIYQNKPLKNKFLGGDHANNHIFQSTSRFTCSIWGITVSAPLFATAKCGGPITRNDGSVLNVNESKGFNFNSLSWH